MPSSITQLTWAQSQAPCRASAVSDQNVYKIWFKKRVDRDFCFRATQLQLCTDSHDQGFAEDISAGSWTWFEIVILANETDTEPKISKEGKQLVWRSHSNRIANRGSPTTHFGAIFDRRSELLVNLEVDDYLAVRVCSRFPGWTNYATSGYIDARVIDADLFTPYRWTLASEILPSLSPDVEDGSYSFVSTSGCFVKSEGNDLVSKIWFTTPALDAQAIDNFEAVQLFTFSRYQKSQTEVPEGDSFSWFDLVILESPSATVPRVENGVSLVWLSHSNAAAGINNEYMCNGALYDTEVESNPNKPGLKNLAIALKGSLKPGNAIGVRVNAQYPGWENYARSGQLIVRVNNKTKDATAPKIPDVTQVDQGMTEIREAMEEFYEEIGYTSTVTAALSNEVRADAVLAPPPAYSAVVTRPLRLLSLDGGGVRGVSPLRILKTIMKKVAEIEGKPDIKPCEYFDMIAGTSTGGLIALMLGRLEMTIEEVEKKYTIISEKVFGKTAHLLVPNKEIAFATGQNLYDPQPLVDAVKSIVKEYLGDPNALMYEETNPNPRCKVLVMTALASSVSNGKTGVHLRNYKSAASVPSESLGWKIWEVARATSAAPAYFPMFKKDDSPELTFVDGGLGFNNPTYELYCEALATYGQQLQNFSVGCMLSLGTGTPPEMDLQRSLASIPGFVAIATNCENMHDQINKSAISFPTLGVEKYWRFNMNKEMSGEDWVMRTVKNFLGFKKDVKVKYEDLMVEMDDWQAIELIRQLTEQWIAHGKNEGVPIKDIIDACAARIAAPHTKIRT